MGWFRYGPNPDRTWRLSDEMLAHLQMIIAAKIKAGEGFFCTISDGKHSTEECVWIAPEVLLDFRFDTTDPIRVHLETLEAMLEAADSSSGLRIVANRTTETGSRAE